MRIRLRREAGGVDRLVEPVHFLVPGPIEILDAFPVTSRNLPATQRLAQGPKRRAGVVVLSNISTAEGPDDIGRYLLDASYPLLKVKPPQEHKEVTADTKTFDSYVGSYQMGPNAILAISREGAVWYTPRSSVKAAVGVLYPDVTAITTLAAHE